MLVCNSVLVCSSVCRKAFSLSSSLSFIAETKNSNPRMFHPIRHKRDAFVVFDVQTFLTRRFAKSHHSWHVKAAKCSPLQLGNCQREVTMQRVCWAASNCTKSAHRIIRHIWKSPHLELIQDYQKKDNLAVELFYQQINQEISALAITRRVPQQPIKLIRVFFIEGQLHSRKFEIALTIRLCAPRKDFVSLCLQISAILLANVVYCPPVRDKPVPYLSSAVPFVLA